MIKERMDFNTAFDETSREVDRILTKAPLMVRTYTSHLSKARGKFIRTFSLLACAMDENGEISPDAVSFASAIEILHLATLVHDDVMDEAKLRRGIATVQHKYGRKTAVICGDYLLSAALRKVFEISDKDQYGNVFLPRYVDQICAGEMRQHQNNGNLDLTIYRYLSIINGKTAALFEASFYAGAVLTETEEHRRTLYRRLGRYIGVIFQLTDDCIDYMETEEAAGKNVQSDFEQGVITLPLIYAFSKNQQFKKEAEEGKMSHKELKSRVLAEGGITFTEQIKKRYYDKSVKILEELNLMEEKRSHINFVLEKAYRGLKA